MGRALAAIQKNVNRQLRKEARNTSNGFQIGVRALSDVPNQLEFWDSQESVFAKEVGSLPAETTLEGAAQADALGLAINLDLVNQEVLDFTSTYTNEWWSRLSGSTRTAMRAAITENIATGAPLRVLESNLAPLFGRARARVIAATETTRMYAEGNRIGYRSAGVTRVEFQTVRDARVDPLCDALQGQNLAIDDEANFPPIHPRCRCWVAPVTTEGEVLKDPTAGARITTKLEEQIGKSAIGKTRNLGGGINETKMAHVRGDGDVVLKPQSGLVDRTIRTGIRPGGDLAREVSAFRVDGHLGRIGRVPETIARTDTPLGESMVQAFIGDSQTLAEIRATAGRIGSVEDFSLFDAVIGNLDRHAGNVLIDNQGRQIMIDHGLAFPERVRLTQFDGNFFYMNRVGTTGGGDITLSSEHLRLLRGFQSKRKFVTEELAGLGLEDDAIEAMWDRVAWMIDNTRYMGQQSLADMTLDLGYRTRI